jgi:hypothetical protein
VEPSVPPPPSLIGISDEPNSNTDSIMKKGGRPKGTTLHALREKEEEKERLIHEIILEWGEHETLAGGRKKKNALQDLIDQKISESELTSVEVSKSCIRQRIQKNIIHANHCGTTSPMAPVEAYIVSLMQQLAKMRQPLNVSEGLSLANALVEGSEWEEIIINFKSKRGWNPLTADGKKKTVVGQKVVCWLLETKQPCN